MLSISLFSYLAAIACPVALAARATFSQHYPWPTRAKSVVRFGLTEAAPFCGDIIHSPQPFAGYSKTFLSFSGNSGDLVSVKYTTNRVPRTLEDFDVPLVSNVSIFPSGQLCLDQFQLPKPSSNPEFGVLLFTSTDSATGKVTHLCSDVKVMDIIILGDGHPAMCAGHNETLIPMPDEYL